MNSFFRKFIDYINRKLKLNNYIQNLFSTASIKDRLLATFILLSIMPITLFGIISVFVTYNNIEKLSTDYSVNLTSKTKASIESVLSNNVDKVSRIASNNIILHEVYNLQSSNVDSYSPIQVKQAISSIVGSGIGIDSVEIVTRSSARIYYSLPITKGIVSESPLITETERASQINWHIGQKEILSDEYYYIILSKKMRLNPIDPETAGYVFMTIKLDYMNELCKQASNNGTFQTIITNESGLIIAHSNPEYAISYLDRKIENNIIGNRTGNQSDQISKPFTINTSEGKMLVTYQNLDLNNWRVITIIPYSYLMQSQYRVVYIFLFSIILIAILVIYFSYMVRDIIINPIDRLNQITSEVSRGNFDITSKLDLLPLDSKNELIQLESKFYKMVFQLQKLIRDVYQANIKEQELEFLRSKAELNALQQQINPHFLYNILDSIYWTAQNNNDEEASEMISALGKFFRSSINKGRDFITIKEEIEGVKNYLYLQRIRFCERFSIIWDISSDILKFRTVKLLIQPIVENAIVHGIENMDSQGEIIIRGYQNEENIYFEISDNGPGISDEELNNINNSINIPCNNDSESIGLKNVMQRLRLYFGDEYGLHIESERDIGTKVILCFPKLD